MSKFVVEFSPPVNIKSKQDDDTSTIVNYCLVLAPFQKQTQVEFSNVNIKETAIKFLTVVNPLDKPGWFVLPPSSDGISFDVYEFTLEPNSQRELTITWQPSSYGNIRKLVKIVQKDGNGKYDFVILGNCIDPLRKKFKDITYSKPKTSSSIKKQFNSEQKKIILNKTRVVNCKSERILLVKNTEKTSESIYPEVLESPIRRQTYLVGEKENFPNLKKNIFNHDTIINSDYNFKHPDKKFQDCAFNNHFNFENQSCSPMSGNVQDNSLKKMVSNSSPFNDFCLTPLKSLENIQNILSPFSTPKKCDGFDTTDESLACVLFDQSPFQPTDASTVAKKFTPEEKKPISVSVNLCNKFGKLPKNELAEVNTTFVKDTINSKSSTSYSEFEQSFDFRQKHESTTTHTTIVSNSSRPKRPSFAVKNSPYSKCNLKASMLSKTRVKQYSILSPRIKRIKTPRLDACDQYLKCLANPELVYHNNAEDPFLKMSRYYEAEWLDRQESDMIQWLNTLLMSTDKLADENQSDDLEQAAAAWIEASKTSHKNKPIQFATQKDLFVAQIYRQSPQQWSALRKAASNLITSTSVATVLSKLTVSIEKDLITVRDDRQIHLDLYLKKKIIDLLKCYNPLWLRIGLEAIYGQIIHVKFGSNDLDGIGWFLRKHLFNNDFIKQKYTKTTVLQVNLPSYNIAMKKFILRKILMLIYFLDQAKEQKLIRHNPCLFKIDSPYKSSYDFLMGFCADLVTAHGDIIRRIRTIDYNLNHKQTYLDEVNYAVKSLNDLRDGTRITRVVEILFKGDLLSQKLRLPAISKLQKIHNVNLALTRISEHINIEGNISTRDIVNGHREKILSLFWQIIYKYITPRYNYAALKIQQWWRNNSLNLVIMKRIRSKLHLKRYLAATKIQACFRGYLIRKQWPRIQPELIENREKLHLASTMIKRYLQNKLKLLTEERKQFIILRRTVVFVQRKFRSKLAMEKDHQQYKKVKQSALLIQKVYRGYVIRNNWLHIKKSLLTNKIKRINSINIIKRALRKNLPPTKDELCYKKILFVTVTIQRRVRANNLMKIQREEYMKLKKSAIILQQRFRAKLAMIYQKEHYLRLKICVLRLQTITRGYIVRKQWPALRDKLQTDKMHLVNSSNIIKRTLRRNLPRTEDRIKFLKLQRSTIVLQKRFRAMRNMRLQKEQYLRLKTITLKLQSFARGYILRKHWPILRSQLQEKRLHLIKCSNIIKRCLRKKLPVTEDRMKFIRLRTATVVLQKRFRAMQDMRLQREQYIRLKAITLKLQSLARGYILRKHWPILRSQLQEKRLHLINCSNIIKRCLRKKLPVTEDRMKFIRLKMATVVLQRRFRAMQMMKNNRQKYIQIKINTIKLQSMVRGIIVRKQWPALRKQLQEDKKRLINCSNIIKRLLRKNLPLTEDRNKFMKLKKSVIVIQRRFRATQAMKRQREQYLQLKTSTLKLQSVARGYLMRKHWLFLRNELLANRQHLINCSNVIKRVLRKNLPITDDRLMFIKLRKAVIATQNRVRVNRQAKKYQILRKNIIMVQRRFRAKMAMKRQKQIYEDTRMITIRLQAYVRGYLARKSWPETKCLLKANRSRLIAASNIIKKFLRRCLPTSQDRLRYLQLRRSVINIQARYRAIVAMKMKEREYMLLKHCVVILQRHYRAHIAMVVQKQQYKCLKKSTVILQAQIRGYLTRKRWPQLKHSLEVHQRHVNDVLECKRLIASHAFLFELNVEMRAAVQLRNWTRNVMMLNRERLQKQNVAASKIQAAIRGFLVRKRLPQLKYELHMCKQVRAAILVQSVWRGYCVRKRYQCRRQTIQVPTKGALTLGRRHNDVVDVLNRQKRNEYSYRELATVFWNLETCTSLSKELCLKTASGMIVDYMFHFLQYSNQSQPSIVAREPAIRVLTNLLKYHETSWCIWMKTVNTDMVKVLIKIMKTCCGKIAANKLYCSIATWLWIALQDPEKKHYIKNIPTAISDLKYMMDTLDRKYKTRKMEKKIMVSPSTRPTWSIGSKCQKCFDSDLYATTQICKLLNI